MRNDADVGSWSLRDLDHAFYIQFDIGEEIIAATLGVIESITNSEIEPGVRFEAYQTLDRLLQGENAVYRTPIIMSISGSAEVQAAVANGCGPSGLGIFPGGWWKECCNEHDECYAQGGGPAAKLICDATFWKCLWSRGAPIIAEIYGLAVLLFGWLAFDWGGEVPGPQPCSGTCGGTEVRITNLRNYQTVGRSVSQVLLNDVPRRGRAMLAAEAEELSRTRWSEQCRSGCHCKITVTGDWRRNVTFLTVPANDPSAHVSYHCEATIWKREVSGTCE